MEGWIKVHRNILASPIFNNPKLLKVWLWCQLKASHKDFDEIIGLQTVKVQAGQFVYGSHKASEELHIPESSVKRYMAYLQRVGFLNIKATNKYSLITLDNWELSQTASQNMDSKTDGKRTTNGHIQDYKKNKFIKPTIKEIQEYCQQKGYFEIDAEYFFNYYESIGWIVGGHNMKSWKAALNNWHKRNCNKHEDKQKIEFNL